MFGVDCVNPSSHSAQMNGSGKSLVLFSSGFLSFYVRLFFLSAVFSSSVALGDPPDNWTRRFQPPSPIALYDIAFGNGIFVAVGYYSGSDFGSIHSSPDGVNWTLRSRPSSNPDPTLGELRTVIFTNGMFITGGWAGYMCRSSNGVDWISITGGMGQSFDGGINDICYAQNQFVGITDWGSVPGSNIVTSIDGIGWTRRRMSSSMSPSLTSVASSGNTFVALESWNGGNSYFWYSLSGISSWSRVQFTTAQYLSKLTYAKGLYVAIGNRNSNGVILTATPSDLPPFISAWTERAFGATNALYDVKCINGLFIATGNSVIATSTNGINWSSRAISNSVGRFTFGNGTLMGLSAGISQSDPLVSVGAHSDAPGELSVTGIPGQNFRIEFNDNLSGSGLWQSSSTFSLPSTPYLWTDSSPPLPPTRFYRAVWVP